jgi:4,5-DOPA dioxygenase extradiol
LNINEIYITHSENVGKSPLLFLGHGSPMNAIEENQFVKGFREIATTFDIPKCILCISAHWETRGTKVTAMERPKTIHDFGGFPRELYEIQYPAPGSPELANDVKKIAQKTPVELDYLWGLDHGAWSVIKHLYPNANIPVIQMSLDYGKKPDDHYELARQLKSLRNNGVLIIGSGNMVHNLRLVAWDKMNESYGYDWAIEANDTMKRYILENDHKSLLNFSYQGKVFKLSIPTPEHYLPLLYILALQEKDEEIQIFNDEPVGGSLTMTSIKIG